MKAATDFPRVVAEVETFWKPLPDKPEETPPGITRALWLAAAGKPLSVERALSADLPDLDAAGETRLRGLIARKQAGEPLAHLSERQNFMGLELLAGPGALIPRKETEILARAALGKLEALATERKSLLVMDICTGSGNLAVTYAMCTPGARVVASDLSEEAVALAKRNQSLLGLPPGRLEFRAGDLFAPFDSEEFVGKCDLVSCNPPYISSAKVPEMHKEISSFEPAMAFNGGIYGVSILTKLIRTAPRFLKKGSWLCFECGLGQGALMAKQVQKLPDYALVETAADAAGEIRAIVARTV